METKSVPLEIKDMSKEKRTAVIAHAVYNNIDRVGDISEKGMFNSSWSRKDPVDFLFNHDETQPLGVVTGLFEDDHKAYTAVKFGMWKIADDAMEMADMGVIKGASFKYQVEKELPDNIKGRSIRRLKQVKHYETSILTLPPANPLAGIVQLNKSVDAEERKKLIDRLDILEKFCRNSNASDETIQYFLKEIQGIKSILSTDDTALTQPITDGSASVKGFSDALYLLTLKEFL